MEFQANNTFLWFGDSVDYVRQRLRDLHEAVEADEDLRAENERLQHAANGLSGELDEARALLSEVQTENERLRALLHAAEQVIEVVRAREIGTAGGVGAAFAAYDELLGRDKCRDV